MSGSRKLLLLGGMALAACGMLYGLHFALFREHQTLDRLGGSLAEAFAYAAADHLPQSNAALDAYASTKYNYVRQVDVHSHWIGLAMLMSVLGAAFERVHFRETARFKIALAMLIGSVAFPLGVILQTVEAARGLGSGLAIAGSVLVTAALALTAWGFGRARNDGW